MKETLIKNYTELKYNKAVEMNVDELFVIKRKCNFLLYIYEMKDDLY